MKQDEQRYSLALPYVYGLGQIGACALVKAMGSATAVFQRKDELPQLVPGVSRRLVEALDCPDAFRRADEELLKRTTSSAFR